MLYLRLNRTIAHVWCHLLLSSIQVHAMFIDHLWWFSTVVCACVRVYCCCGKPHKIVVFSTAYTNERWSQLQSVKKNKLLFISDFKCHSTLILCTSIWNCLSVTVFCRDFQVGRIKNCARSELLNCTNAKCNNAILHLNY